jgi:hypothetical protein
MKKVIGVLFVFIAISVYGQQVITCQTLAGVRFAWTGGFCPAGSIQVF